MQTLFFVSFLKPYSFVMTLSIQLLFNITP